LIAGCGRNAMPLPVAVPDAARIAHAARGGSWMSAEAAKQNLLYVSDYETDDVYAYSYPDGKLSGVLRGILKTFIYPTGLCTDTAGDVFIPDSGNAGILVYAHGGTKVVRTLHDAGEYPYSCVVDPKSGDLAVVDLESVSGPGGVSIYAQAAGRPRFYNHGFTYKYFFAAYDADGNLFVDAAQDIPSAPFEFLERRAKGKQLEQVTLDADIAIPGGVVWDGQYVAVEDSKTATIDRFAISNLQGKKAGSVTLSEAKFPAQFLVADGHVVAAEFHGKRVGFWAYPGGGAPAKTIDGFGYPFGIALSDAPH
jgi:sugar lactone lactonase YvrE